MKEIIGAVLVIVALWCVFDKYFIVLTGKKYYARVISSGVHANMAAFRQRKDRQWTVDIDGRGIPVEVGIISVSPLKESALLEIKSGKPKNVYTSVYYSARRPGYAVQLSHISPELISAFLLLIGICLIFLGG